MIRFFVCSILVILSFAISHAEEKSCIVPGTTKITIHYRFDDCSIDENYMDNCNETARLKAIISSPTIKIDRITIQSWSSPDGSYRYNEKLAFNRGDAVREFILKECAVPADSLSDRIKIYHTAENWEGLKEMVLSSYTRHDRDKVLRILADTSVGPETRKWRLQQLDGGYTWDFLRRRYMPQLRLSTVICIHMTEQPEQEIVIEPEVITEQEPQDSLVSQPVITPAAEQATPVIPKSPRAVFALRSNLLVPLMNIGAELPIGNHWSVGADYYFPWIWPSKKNKDCFELLGWSVEGRYWFGKNRTVDDRLHGHSLGLYGAGGYYDFERNYEGQQGEFASAGLDYTYAMSLGRKKRVNLEFTIAVGYIHAWARNYNVPGEEGPLFKEEGDILFDYFGPTKAAVSLVIPFYGKEGRK